MGGSIAKTLRKSLKIDTIVALGDKKEELEMAKKEGVIDQYTMEVNSLFSNLDFIFIATPVSYIYDYVEQLRPYVSDSCIITDIGSTKKGIVEKVEKLDLNFIGGHPMVGSEKAGYIFSTDYLYENAYYILTKTKKTKPHQMEKLKEIIRELKALPIEIVLDKHDYIVATISHIPHIVAAALVHTVKQLDDSQEMMKRLAAGGFRDITRIASGSPTMWQAICKENEQEISKVLQIFKNVIQEFEENSQTQEKRYSYFETAKVYRDSLDTKIKTSDILYDITVDVKDTPGVIATIAAMLSKYQINIKNIGIMNNREQVEGVLKIILPDEKQRIESIKILKNAGYTVFENKK